MFATFAAIFEALDAIEEELAEVVTPVSYTHLDVYKRQARPSTWVVRPSTWVVSLLTWAAISSSSSRSVKKSSSPLEIAFLLLSIFMFPSHPPL